jgi:hypothetical protein
MERVVYRLTNPELAELASRVLREDVEVTCQECGALFVVHPEFPDSFVAHGHHVAAVAESLRAPL